MVKVKAALWCVMLAAAPVYADSMVVQIGSFRDAGLAKQQSARAALLGVQTHVTEQRLSGGKDQGGRVYYRVRTGAMPQQQAEQLAVRLRQNNIEAIVLEKP